MLLMLARLVLSGGSRSARGLLRSTSRLWASEGGPKTVSQALSQLQAAAPLSTTTTPTSTSSSSSSGVGFKKEKPAGDESVTVNLKGLKQEVSRVILRTFKKVGKANERLQRAEEEYASVMEMESPPLDKLEACPDPDELKAQLLELQNNLNQLRDLEESLKDIKSTADAKFSGLWQVAKTYNISDTAPPPPERGPKKPKGKAPLPRLPYNLFTSNDGIEIRVGRTSSDNDQLSCNFEYRDATDWWLHVAGFPGSHIIIRSGDDDLPQKFPETLKDAAILAAVNSKAAQAGRVGVSFCRARQVSKPAGAKPGMVRLSGDVGTITLDLKAERKRYERLTAGTGTGTGSD